MFLEGIHIAGEKTPVCLQLRDNLITGIGHDIPGPMVSAGEITIRFENARAFPGLINSHDHLDFNLFPLLGGRFYQNYIEWGADIQTRFRDQIGAVTRVPVSLRNQWGVVKNLLGGVTTVVNHGKQRPVTETLVHVFQSCHSLHSVNREPYWKMKLNNPFSRRGPFVIHAGEGVDESVHREISTLLRWNLLKRELVAIHGVAMDEQQAANFRALVWCPASNFFLLGQTAPVDRLKNKTRILFGTDSTLTGNWNIWEQLRQAKDTGLLSDQELFESVTNSPAAAWGLHDRGELTAGKKADIVIARSKNPAGGTASLFDTNPEDLLLVLKDGEPVLFDSTLYPSFKSGGSRYHSFDINGAVKYIAFDLPGLIRQIREYYPQCPFPVSAG